MKKLIQVFNLELKIKIANYVMTEEVEYWIWINTHVLALITKSSVFHFTMERGLLPQKVFNRNPALDGFQISNYCADPSQQWFLLIGVPDSKNIHNGTMQLYSVNQRKSQMIKGCAGVFVSVQLENDLQISTLMCFVNSFEQLAKLYVFKIGLPQTGNHLLIQQSINMSSSVETGGKADYPLIIQAATKYDCIYVVTKYGYVHMYDIATGTCCFIIKVSADPIVVTAPQLCGGIILVNRKGHALSLAINEDQIITYIAYKIQNEKLALRLAAKYNISGADELFEREFNTLFENGKYIEAAKVAAKAPNGKLRTSRIVRKLRKAGTGTSTELELSPIITYFGILLDQTKLNEHESLELCNLLLSRGEKELLRKWINDDKLENTKEIGDLF